MPTEISDIRMPPTIVPVVAPDGRVINLRVSGRVPHHDIIENGGEDGRGRSVFVVRGVYMRQGYQLLEDAYRDARDAEGWAKYRQYLDDWTAGRTRSSFPADILPAKVLELRGKGVKKNDPWAAKKADADPPTEAEAKGKRR